MVPSRSVLSRPLATVPLLAALACAAIGGAAGGCSSEGEDAGSASASESARPPSGLPPSEAVALGRDGAALSEILQRLPSATPARSSGTSVGTETHAAEGDAPKPSSGGGSI